MQTQDVFFYPNKTLSKRLNRPLGWLENTTRAQNDTVSGSFNHQCTRVSSYVNLITCFLELCALRTFHCENGPRCGSNRKKIQFSCKTSRTYYGRKPYRLIYKSFTTSTCRSNDLCWKKISLISLSVRYVHVFVYRIPVSLRCQFLYKKEIQKPTVCV